jgi:hypothetical protein
MSSPQIGARVLSSGERYRTLLDINNVIITNLTQESLLTAICEAIQHVLPQGPLNLTRGGPESQPVCFDSSKHMCKKPLKNS